MNTISISPFRLMHNQTQKNYLNNRPVIQPKFAQTLERDTVSFTARPTQISDFVEKGVSDNMGRLQRIATTYLDVLESVALRLKDKGFSFDRAYCELNPVKSPQSYTSKVVRSGKFKVPDTIRATLYCSNIYDLDTLNTLLRGMKLRGYVVSDTEMPIKELIKRGYKPTPEELKNVNAEKIVPDLDIRLEDVTEQLPKLDEKFQYSIGKQQKSGYEDIQIRFVRDFDKKKNPVQHELILLFGPNYSQAKHLESEKVYSFLRLFSELNMKFTDNTLGTHSQKANRYIDLIQQMFRGKVSEKLFMNAKNKDLYDINEEVPITFSETDKKMFESYFSGLKDRLASCYKEELKYAKVSESATKQLKSELRHDRTLLTKIQDNLRETIEYFNHRSGLKETKD